MTLEELDNILKRFTEAKQSEADYLTLSQMLSQALSSETAEQSRIVLQLAKYNVNIKDGKGIQIGDRTFKEVNEAALEALTHSLPTLNRFKTLIEDKTKWFVGRTYVFEAIEAFIASSPNGYFTIIGDPGQGKSAILAKYIQMTGCVAYFNVQLQGNNKAEQFLESICSQLIIRYNLPYEALPSHATQNGEFLNHLLEEAADKAEGHPIVIAVDALDEVDTASYGDANILYLPPHLPDNVYFILTRRRVNVPLTLYVATQSLSLLNKEYRADCEEDLRIYIQLRIDSSEKLQEKIKQRQESMPDFTGMLTEKSEINFMYLRYILQDIESGLYQDLELTRFPSGLQGYYEFHWRRMGMTQEPLPVEKIKVIYILGEVREPVSRRKICDFSGESKYAVQRVLTAWEQFLTESIKNEKCYSIYHTSFRDFLHRQDILEEHPVTIPGIHQLIAKNELKVWQKLKGVLQNRNG